MAGTAVGIQGPSIWTVQHSFRIYKGYEASNSCSKEARHQNDLVSRQYYVGGGRWQEASRDPCSTSIEPLSLAWIPPKLEKSVLTPCCKLPFWTSIWTPAR